MLESLTLGQLMFLEDDKELAWTMLEAPQQQPVFLHLSTVTLDSLKEPATIITFLILGPYPRLTEMNLGLGGDYVDQLWDREHAHY
ncbi:hypothetical protein VNI00_019280, partial [Paramarasmius palmivorus]